MSRILAIDCGGTSCRALLVDDSDAVLGRAVGPEANLYRCGQESVVAAVAGLYEQLGGDVLALSVAGARTVEDCRRLGVAIERALGGKPTMVYGDARCALRGGTELDSGVVIVAGTGSAAYGRDRQGHEARAGGWGYRLGDEGSGYWLGVEGLRAAVRAAEGGTQTALLQTLLGRLGIADIDELRTAVYDGDSTARIADLARDVGTVAAAGDAVARQLVARAADELVNLAASVIAHLDLEPRSLVALAGGLWIGVPALSERVREAMPGWDVQIARRDAAWGALFLARVDLRNEVQRPAEGGTDRDDRESPVLSEMTTPEILRAMNDADAGIVPAVATALPALAGLIEATWPRLARSGRLIYFGAGTSGRLGMLDAAECVPTFGVPPSMVEACIAGGPEAMVRAIEGAEDDVEAGKSDVIDLAVGENDVVVGISASGGAPYVYGAVTAARRAGAVTGAVLCRPESALQQVAEHVVLIPVGEEVLRGSTRLKAGTATKLVLNMLSTACMVRLGRVDRNLMTHMRPSNTKLRRRAIGILVTLGNVDERAAESLLRSTNWDVSLALSAARTGHVDSMGAEPSREERNAGRTGC